MTTDHPVLPFPSRRRVFLLRHADVNYFDADGTLLSPVEAGLNEVGRGQGEAIARELAGIAFDRLVSSDLPRCLETARALNGTTLRVVTCGASHPT